MNCPDRQIDAPEDLIYTALPDYNPAACLLESDAEVKKFTTSLAVLSCFSYLQEESSERWTSPAHVARYCCTQRVHTIEYVMCTKLLGSTCHTASALTVLYRGTIECSHNLPMVSELAFRWSLHTYMVATRQSCLFCELVP